MQCKKAFDTSSFLKFHPEIQQLITPIGWLKALQWEQMSLEHKFHLFGAFHLRLSALYASRYYPIHLISIERSIYSSKYSVDSFHGTNVQVSFLWSASSSSIIVIFHYGESRAILTFRGRDCIADICNAYLGFGHRVPTLVRVIIA